MGERLVRLFVASPSDVSDERKAVEEVAKEINEGRVKGLCSIDTQVLRWESFACPAAGRPEQVILDQLGDYDILVAILWTRCGTPTGHDNHGQEIARSGTVEEIRDAFARVEQGLLREEQVLVYRCERKFVLPTNDDLMQYVAVHALFEEISNSKKALTWKYSSVGDFRGQLTRHLVDVIKRLLEERQNPRVKVEQHADYASEEPAIRLPRLFVKRESYVAKVRLLIEEYGVCVLCGPSGSGKSTIAAQYYNDNSQVEKKWINCKSALQSNAGVLDLADTKLVVLDGFEDRRFCWEALRRIHLKAFVIVTITDSSLCKRIMREIGCADQSCLIAMRDVEVEQWNEVLSKATGSSLTLIFQALHASFRGSMAGLKLVLAALAQEDNPEKTLTRIRLDLNEKVKVENENEIRLSENIPEPRHKPESYIASLWLRHNIEAGKVMQILSTVPLVGMSVSSLATLLERSEDDIEGALRALEEDSFVYQCRFGTDTLWVALDYYREVFENLNLDMTIAETRELDVLRDTYVQYCESNLQKGLLGKLDSAFVRAARAFESDSLPYITINLAQSLKIVDDLRSAQSISDSHWAPIAHAIARRAKSCQQVIAIAQNLSKLGENLALGDLAWRMTKVDDWWAETTAVYAAVRHWRGSPNREEHAEKIRLRLSQLVDSDQWFKKNSMEPWSDMLPAVLLGGLIALGFEGWAREQIESETFKKRVGSSTFSHLVPIFQAADCGANDQLKSLIDRHWSSVRGGILKQFAAEYIEQVYPGFNLKVDGFAWKPDYDPRRTAAQVAFSAGAIEYLETKLPMHSRRIKNEMTDVNILGNYTWFAKM